MSQFICGAQRNIRFTAWVRVIKHRLVGLAGKCLHLVNRLPSFGFRFVRQDLLS